MYLLHGHVLSTNVLQMYVNGRLINCQGNCVLQGNMYGMTEMGAYIARIISAGYVLWGVSIGCQSIAEVYAWWRGQQTLQHYRGMYWLCMYKRG